MNVIQFSNALNTIRYLPIPRDILALSLFDDCSPLQRHPDYSDAKAGNFRSALRLISDLAWDALDKKSSRFGSHTIFVAPFARETTGDNAIPQVLAEVLAYLSGASADKELVQVTKVYHIGSNPMERLVLRAEFEGPVQAGANYVLVETNLSVQITKH